MKKRNQAVAATSEPHGDVSTAKKVSASLVLVFTLIYFTFEGARSSDHDQGQIDALITDLGAGHPSKRYAARKALRKMGRPAVPALSEALSNDDVDVRHGAVEALRSMGPDAEAALPALIAALEDEMIRSDAVRTLAAIGPAAMPFVTDVLAHPDRDMRSTAVYTIGSIAEDFRDAGEPAPVPALIALMRDPGSAGEPDWSHEKQLKAHMDLFKKRSPDIEGGWETLKQANEMIEEGAAFGSAEERDDLLLAMDKARKQMMRGAPAFKKALNASRPRASMRPNIARALGDIGAPAVPALLELLADADPDFRKMSTIAFTEMGKEINDDFDEPLDIGDEVEPAVSGLIHALVDEDADVQSGAVNALAAFGDEAIAPLIQALDDGEVARRANAAKALGRIEPPAEDAVPALAGALGDDHPEVRLNAIEALLVMETAASQAAPAIAERLVHDDDPKVRKVAADALGRFRDLSAIPTLIEAIGDDDSHVRRLAAQSLYYLGDASIPAVVEALGHENDVIRGNAETFVLAVSTEARAQVTKALRDALDDDREAVRARAKDILAIIEQRR